jgi:enoyl-CoA hydratase/carnithine racemase
MSAIAIETGTDEVLCTVRDRVATITLNRPEARNSLSDSLTPALRNMIKLCGEDNGIGAIVLTGAGKAFCAGGNVKGMGSNDTKASMTFEERVIDLQERQRTLTGALRAIRKPTIAALPGAAAGASLSIALACDIRIAAESAFVSTAYMRVGLSGDLRHRVAFDASGGNGPRARTDVHGGPCGCPTLRGHRPCQPRRPG